jgi:mono/diheme cytochrome c family protein
MLKKIAKWILICVGVLILFITIAVFWLKSTADRRLNKTYTVSPQVIKIPKDSASLERGKYLAHVLCAECHGGNGFMGMTIFDDPELGKVNAPNLTSGLGGIGSAYSDEDWVRVLRNGVKPNGKGVFVMPSKDFHAMGEDDLGSLIAYMKAVPPVDKEWERESQLTVFAKVLLALGAFGDVISAENINHTAMAELSPTPAPTGEYGNYIVRIFGCRTCHGQNLNGSKDPNPAAPFAPNLTGGGQSGKWKLEEFKTCMRTGRTPDGRQLTDFMPWKALANMTDDDLQAVYLYLQSLPDMQTASN